MTTAFADYSKQVFVLSDEEKARNQEYLETMEEETGVKPLWLKN